MAFVLRQKSMFQAHKDENARLARGAVKSLDKWDTEQVNPTDLFVWGGWETSPYAKKLYLRLFGHEAWVALKNSPGPFLVVPLPHVYP